MLDSWYHPILHDDSTAEHPLWFYLIGLALFIGLACAFIYSGV
jgi:hypothetical protein